MLWDTHMHTHFSGDSEADTFEMAQASINAGLEGICFTDHMDLDYLDEAPEKYLIDFPAYFKEMQSIQRQLKDKFSICIGVELGLQPHLGQELSEIADNYPFDFIIGSSHMEEVKIRHTENILNPFLKIWLSLTVLMYMDTLTMWYAMDQTEINIILMRNSLICWMKYCAL